MIQVSVCSPRSILTPCGLENINYQMDPYVGCEHHCYYCYALDKAETDWTQEVRVHKSISRQLREELKSIDPQIIYMGYETDPYQPIEAEYRQTRQALELLQEEGFSASILTKSNLVTRDIDVLQGMPAPQVSVSVAFNDDRTRRLFEANTMDTALRLQALRDVRAAGITTGALICPVIPYVTDPRPLLDALAPFTDTIWIYGLSAGERAERGWQNVRRILDRDFPERAEDTEAVVLSRGRAYWSELREELEVMAEQRQLDLRIHL